MSQALSKTPSVQSSLLLFEDKFHGEASIYVPEVRDHLCKLLEGKTALMVDMDGVLRGKGYGVEIEAFEVAKELFETGYTMMLWTQASDTRLDVTRFLKQSKLQPFFPIVIHRENYELKTEEQRLNYKAAINQTVWLDMDTRKQFEALADEGGQSMPKTPHLFTDRCGIVDDSAWVWYQSFSPEIIGSMRKKDGSCPYPLFQVRDSYHKGVGNSDQYKDEYFGLSWLSRIKKELPMK